VSIAPGFGATAAVSAPVLQLSSSAEAATPAKFAGAFSVLKPQERKIVRLAARALSNRDERRSCSSAPRTVGCDLYEAFPKLGITARTG
jgi:hypothetical protein